MKRIVVLALLLGACQTQVEGPLVEHSATVLPEGNIVDITKEGDWGVPCLTIAVGETVEWRNFAPEIPVNVTSLSDPPELYSPTLVAPYPNTGFDTIKGPYIWWRHTFTKPGVYEYFDTNSGDPGKKVVDPYYGTVTFVGLSPNLKTGMVCVREPGSPICRGVCCVRNYDNDGSLSEDECPKAECCDSTFKRCRLGSPALQVCAGKFSHREFDCLDDSHCPPDQAGQPQQCLIDPIQSHACD